MSTPPSTPPFEPPIQKELSATWWQNWVDAIRNLPGAYDDANGDQFFYGEHLYVGCETHNLLLRSKRAVSREDPLFSDSVHYEDVSDLRTWKETTPAPLFLHEKILAEHCYIVGPSGSGKSSLGSCRSSSS